MMKKILLIILAIVVIAAVGALFFFQNDTSNPYKTETLSWGKYGGTCSVEDIPSNDFGSEIHSCDYTVPKEEIPVFKDAKISFSNKYNGEKSLPLTASALIDINNDGIDELFVGGGLDKEDALFSYKNGGFEKATFNLPAKSEKYTTYGAVSFDLDNDGKVDLFLTTDIGVFCYH